MNTLARKGMLNKHENHTIILDGDLEFAFERSVLSKITEDWNNGASINFIAKREKRDPDEVFLAIFHQARKGKIKRKLNIGG